MVALPSDDLARIVEHFHELGPLGSTRVSTDMLGQAYEWLIAKFAAASGKGGGEFLKRPCGVPCDVIA